VAAADFTPQALEATGSPISARLARAYNAAVDQVARSFEERQAAAREFQRFLADAGHELRTPLTIVSGYVDLLDSDKDRVANGDRIVAGMRAETKRMRNLVEKMLLLARMESTASHPRALALGETVGDAVDAARSRYPHRTLAFNCDDAATIVADEDDIFEAVYNLLENALRYAPESEVAVDVARTPASALVSVSDRGPGIAADERERVFERFYRGAARTNAEGSGLGLAIVKRAVERWRGTVELESVPGSTRFTLAFPLAEAATS
jgi:two-component system OmpR family sensor kinase